MSKRLLSATLLTALFSLQVSAQTISEPISSVTPEVAAQGFRIALIKPILKYRVKAEARGESSSSSGDIKNTMGLSVGYAKLPVRQIGIMGSFSLLQSKEDKDKMNMWRANGSAAYSINSNVIFFGGLNVSHITNSEVSKYLDPSIGAQAGASFQFNRNFGLDVGYVLMRQTGKVRVLGTDVDVEVSESGPEVSLHGTF